MNNSTGKQTDISGDTLIDKNVKNKSVSGIDFNVSINTRRISTKGLSSAGVNITDEGRLMTPFVQKPYLILVVNYLPKQKLKF